MTKQIAILGSTGSIGKNALRVVDGLGSDYSIAALSAHRNIELLAEQARQFRPRAVAVTDPTQVDAFRKLIPNLKTDILSGLEALEAIACAPEIDTVLSAIVGAAGLPSVFAAAACGKRLAIANKEPLVIAGELLMSTAKQHGSTVLPIDSEHSAVFQALQAGSPDQVQRIILTRPAVEAGERLGFLPGDLMAKIDPYLRRSFTNIDAEKALTPEFPNETTANQNFSERKVLAHRALGRELVLARRADILAAVNEVQGEEQSGTDLVQP